MVKNKVSIRITCLVLFIISTLLICIAHSQHLPLRNYYYRYSIGRIEIDNPVIVSFDGKEYVCPDSAITYCSDSNWINRNDVYPYVFMVEEGKPVSYSSFLHKTRLWDEHYYPFYVDTISSYYKGDTTYMYKSDGSIWRKTSTASWLQIDSLDVVARSKYKPDTTIYRFYYNINTFDAYMQSLFGYWYDSSDPDILNPDADYYDAFAYSTQYRIAVRQHYTTWQIIQLRWYTQKKQKDPEYIGFHNILE